MEKGTTPAGLAVFAERLGLNREEVEELLDELADHDVRLITDTVVVYWGPTPTRLGTSLADNPSLPSLRELLADGWRVVRAEDVAEWRACQRSDGSWRVHSNSSVHMDGPCHHLAAIIEEWTP